MAAQSQLTDQPPQKELKKVLPVGKNESGLLVAFTPYYKTGHVEVKDGAGRLLDKLLVGPSRFEFLKYKLRPGAYDLYLPAARVPVRLYTEPGIVKFLVVGDNSFVPVGKTSGAEISKLLAASKTAAKPKVLAPAKNQIRISQTKNGPGTDDPGPSGHR